MVPARNAIYKGEQAVPAVSTETGETIITSFSRQSAVQ